MGRMTYLLDSNVLSEPTRPRPKRSVLTGLRRHEGTLCTAAPVVHEMRYGVLRLPEGRRRSALQNYVQTLFDTKLPILPYDQAAAEWHAAERARLERLGIPVPYVDSQIAAITAVNGLVLVTRNDADFASFAGLETENWFEERK